MAKVELECFVCDSHSELDVETTFKFHAFAGYFGFGKFPRDGDLQVAGDGSRCRLAVAAADKRRARLAF